VEPTPVEPTPVVEEPAPVVEPTPVVEEPAPVVEPTPDTSPPPAGDQPAPEADGHDFSRVARGQVRGEAPTRTDDFPALSRQRDFSAASSHTEVNQCNGIANVGGQTVTCNVTITNNFTGDPATSTQRVCTDTGPGTTQTCNTTTGTSIQTITQCNGSGSGGGGTVNCNVTIINNVSAGAALDLIIRTVTQCVDSGQGGGAEPTTNCSPPNTPGAPVPPDG